MRNLKKQIKEEAEKVSEALSNLRTYFRFLKFGKTAMRIALILLLMFVNIPGTNSRNETAGGVSAMVEVLSPEAIYVKHFSLPKLYLNAGTQHLDGKQAEQVVRARIEIGDFGRIRNQTLVLKALAAKMLTPNGIKQIPDMVTRLMTYVLTDFSAADVSKMACMAALIDPKEDIIFDNVIPVEEEAQIGEWIQDEYLGYKVYALSYDREVLTQKLADFQAGIWPEQ